MRIRLRLESRLALLIGSVFGLPAVFLIPPAVTFDGPSHYFRSLQVSRGGIWPQVFSDRAVGGILPKSHVEFINSQWESYWTRHDFGTLAEWSASSSRSLEATGNVRVEFTNTAVYSPANYALQALGMGISGLFSASPLSAHRAACLLNLAGYLAAVVSALELLPRFHKGALILVSFPLAMIQAASVSADAINFAMPLLLLAYAWNLRERRERASGRDMAIVLALGMLVVLLKPNAAAALTCLWLIPARHFSSGLAKTAALCAYFACAAAVWFAWNRANMNVDVARWFEPSRPQLSVQKAWFFGDPRRFIHPLWHFLANDMIRQWPHMYAGVGGWIPPRLYGGLSWLSLICLAGLAGSGSWNRRIDWIWAAGMGLQSFAVLTLIALALWISFGTVEMDYIPGFTGRYLHLATAGFAITWAELFHAKLPRLRDGLSWIALAANCAGLTAILVSIASRTA